MPIFKGIFSIPLVLWIYFLGATNSKLAVIEFLNQAFSSTFLKFNNRLYRIVSPIAKHAIFRLLATAEINRFGFRCRQWLWGKFSPLMTTIAKGLILAFATRAPIVSFTCFNIDWVGCFLSDCWFHGFSFVKISFKRARLAWTSFNSFAVNWPNTFSK